MSRKVKKSAAEPVDTQHVITPQIRARSAPEVDSKSAAIIRLLRQNEGTTLEQMMEATGWQKHSIRGFMSGALRKRHCLTAVSAKTGATRIYQIEPAEAAS